MSSPRRPLLLLAALLLPVVGPGLAAQKPHPAASAAADVGTGDRWIDQRLADIDLYVQRYPGSFLDEVGRYGGVRRGYAEALLVNQHWQAGDIYFACFMAQALGRPCRELVRARTAAGSWNAALQALPTPPDNLAFRDVRHRLVASYDHWDRPVTLDAVLRAQLGDRSRRDAAARGAAETATAQP